MQHSFALLERQIHGSRRQFGATAVGGTRQEEKAQRAVAASSKSKPCIAPPLPHNEMLARTYSASNFGSITPLANQMTAPNQSANSECLNSWVLFWGA